MQWQTIAVVLCSYGLLKEFRPSEPYMFVYQNSVMNISAEVLNGDVYPYWTYSYLVALIPVFVLTDLLLYKSVLILESVSYIAVWLLLIFGRAVWTQQLVELFYGWATATEVAYFAYIYVKVDKEHFARVTVWTRAALQSGKCLSYLLSQLIVMLGFGSYLTLNYISLGSLCITFVFALVLPWVDWKEVVVRETSNKENLPLTPDSSSQPATYKQFVLRKLRNLSLDLKRIYSDAFLLKWSLWWAMTTCGNLMISNYIQTLWAHKQSEESQIYNGTVEALSPLLAVVAILLLQVVQVDWNRWGELCLTVAALADFGLLFVLSRTTNLFVMYACYAIFRVIYQSMITISQFNLADRLVVQSYGLIFGFNTLVALALQAAMTFVVVDKRGLGMEIQPQFLVYAFYHLSIASVFLFAVLCRTFRKLCFRRKRTFYLQNDKL